MNVVRLVRTSGGTVRLVHMGGVVYYVGSSSDLPALPLPVVADGQTRWNVGGSEPRKTLFFNGERMVVGVHYRIELPFLDWLAPVLIDVTDSLILTV